MSECISIWLFSPSVYYVASPFIYWIRLEIKRAIACNDAQEFKSSMHLQAGDLDMRNLRHFLLFFPELQVTISRTNTDEQVEYNRAS